MINTIYKPLFGFVIKNNFYKNGNFKTSSNPNVSEDFHILLSKSTQNILRQFGMLFREKINGFDLFAQSINTGPGVFSVAKKLDKASKLVFFLQLKNPGFLSFTDVAYDQLAKGKVYYGNNLGINTDARESLRICTNAEINSVDDLVKLIPSNYTYQHLGLANNTAAKVIAIDGPDFVIAKSADQNNGKTDFTFDLTTLQPGRYKLEIFGVLKEEFYYAGNQKNIFAVIEIFFEGTQPNYQILEPAFTMSLPTPKHVLNFQRRKTFWRYIINMNNTMLANPSLEISDGSISFIKVSQTAKQAIFVSNTTMDSMEDPLLRGSPAVLERVILKDGIKEIIANLPVPDPTIIKIENNQFYTEISINI
jgi:hypothetical protein